ncbi:solute carrier organic anion transporter family member 1C1-like [Pristis pectinata]|uniref:solute carrier organic anion transporter family member 1C1-like n=1 Tax=Pristis pectinata TaxID=685728 RepID=UPI00223CB6A3|nr:solute carrier organic anion transporter family member 1C1-like [Pristis pectinata]XP_051889874.1 solute carrier organic anion transporter family member 1C1-like [Pristis pectinata]XP_051889875.1 solute carrier organic anion transporter family member 1C1-like [Pristis pectinata]
MENPLKEKLNTTVNSLPPKEKRSHFNNLKVFLAVLSFSYFAKTLSGSYIKSTITQLERRFDLSSSLIGIIDGSFEIGNLLVISFVSYFGAKLHRPRLIAIGCLIMGLGTLLIALPHFFMGRYNYETALTFSSNSTTVSQCSNDSSSTGPGEISNVPLPGCEKGGSPMWIYIFLGNLLRGIGETPVTPLGLSYLDDHAIEENASFYIGILHTIALVGPLFGFLLGSYCAKIFVDIGFVDLERVTISARDARWVGAWWLGFLIAGTVAILSSIPFWFFPKSLTKELRKKELSKTREKMEFFKQDLHELAGNNAKSPISATGFISSVKSLFTNHIYISYLLSMVLQVNALVGLLSFKAKFIEQQYGQSASKSNFLIGLLNIPAVCLGIFFGGLVMKRFKLNIIQAIKMNIGCSVVGWLLALTYFGMGCDNSRVAGLTVSYEGNPQISFEGSGLYHDCNIGCSCSRTQWEPICAGNGISYVTPCLAGCKTSSGAGKNIEFHNCSCISTLAMNSSALLGQCSKSAECQKIFPYYLAFSVLSAFSYSFGAIPGFMVLLRCTEPGLKSLAIGVQTLIIRALAGIPAPVYFGALIDRTCLKWGMKRCGGQGACRMYDSNTFRNIFLGLQTILRGFGILVFLRILMLAKRQFQAKGQHTATKCDTEVMPFQDKDCGPGNGDLPAKVKTSDPIKESHV